MNKLKPDYSHEIGDLILAPIDNSLVLGILTSVEIPCRCMFDDTEIVVEEMAGVTILKSNPVRREIGKLIGKRFDDLEDFLTQARKYFLEQPI